MPRNKGQARFMEEPNQVQIQLSSALAIPIGWWPWKGLSFMRTKHEPDPEPEDCSSTAGVDFGFDVSLHCNR